MADQENHDQETTHFGFRDVPVTEKAGLVGQVFHSVASKYDLMNDLMSMGIHRAWKRFAIEQMQLRPGLQVLDVAGGTGDLTKRIAPRIGKTGKVVLSDINSSMLEAGRDRLVDEGIVGNVEIVQANAESLPFPDNHFDRIIIGFGLRNVTHKDEALASMYRVLKPGGQLLILEFSKPTLPGLGKIYDSYSFNILPMLGKVVAKDEASYRYLAESIRKHPDQETLKQMMTDAGFERSHYFNLSGGIVAVHKGYKL
ncbi:MAG: bifunctional demethylmenaquinone methyltransferase/2-methoxy-6-polyprenyl-1,4-benzoquinol methylase UbiE [Acidiferrobacterales bacterium]|nr:bifunctional demethylmenaquinone methyltransferase/2-methoxy-6-polyprenyl-1,4-benzoquinol methylase UbiE [Acidiferrobacterales bacterium]